MVEAVQQLLEELQQWEAALQRERQQRVAAAAQRLLLKQGVEVSLPEVVAASPAQLLAVEGSTAKQRPPMVAEDQRPGKGELATATRLPEAGEGQKSSTRQLGAVPKHCHHRCH